ncbi:MAG: hypothetical protein HZB59_11005 [Ignavibacteriales bacterium]|nr:hypothetical protein [Ignavibacteriales bacterium]
MKQGKRVKPKFPIEYRLLIMPLFKEREQKHVTLFAMRTINEFNNFRYEISIDTILKEDIIRFTINGLKAPQMNLPGTGPAVKEIEFENLKGEYQIIISKHGKDENKFFVDISDKQVMLVKTPRKKFSEIVTDSKEW